MRGTPHAIPPDMTNANIDRFVTLLAETTMQAAADIIRARGIDTDSVDIARLCDALRAECKLAIGRILDDGKVLLDGGRAGWLNTLVRTECVAAATAAIAEAV